MTDAEHFETLGRLLQAQGRLLEEIVETLYATRRQLLALTEALTRRRLLSADEVKALMTSAEVDAELAELADLVRRRARLASEGPPEEAAP